MKRKIMAMVFAAMMMVASFTATSSEQWANCDVIDIYCGGEIGWVGNVMVCGDTDQEAMDMYEEWEDILCD